MSNEMPTPEVPMHQEEATEQKKTPKQVIESLVERYKVNEHDGRTTSDQMTGDDFVFLMLGDRIKSSLSTIDFLENSDQQELYLDELIMAIEEARQFFADLAWQKDKLHEFISNVEKPTDGNTQVDITSAVDRAMNQEAKTMSVRDLTYRLQREHLEILNTAIDSKGADKPLLSYQQR